MEIRPYQPQDRDRVAYICLMTGNSGKGSIGRHADDDLLPSIWAFPYVDYAPEWAWVVEGEEGAVGYVLAVPDLAEFRKWWQEVWVPKMHARFPAEVRADWPEDDQRRFNKAVAPESPLPPWHEEYPAQLHINLLPDAQGQGFGRELIDALFTQMRERRVPGLALSVGGDNPGAIGFYDHLGFDVAATDYYDNGKLRRKVMVRKA